MANSFIKAERVVRLALGLLEREIVLPRLVWRDAAGDFAGAKDDTISIRLPAYTTARERVLRGGTPITIDELEETKVDVTLDTDVYKAVGISDEELTLDIADFGEQVMDPVVRSVARKVEEKLATEITGATYEVTVEADPDEENGQGWYNALVDARKALNDAGVPQAGRSVAVGSTVEANILKSPHLAQADRAGDANALRDAQIGRIAGFNVVSVPGMDPEVGVAFHRTAFVLSTRSPIVPQGATWGASESFGGIAMRTLRDYDFVNVRDRLLADLFMGTNVVEDFGHIDDDGKFIPAMTEDESGAESILVRAVKLVEGS